MHSSRVLFTSLIGLLTGLMMIVSSALWAQSDSSWRFNVLLDGKPVGEHLFTVTPQDGLIQVQSEASMEVNFLFFNAYSYQHRASELWQAGCLFSIDAATNNNSKQIEVKGRLDAGAFLVSASSTSTTGNTAMPACVKSFAYWDRSFLESNKLLNSQTGELVDIQVQTGKWETIEAVGREWLAQRFTLTGDKLHIDLWYGPAGEWLRLSSQLPSGRQVDYVLVEGSGWDQNQRAVKTDDVAIIPVLAVAARYLPR